MSLQRNGRRSFLRGILATGAGVTVGLPTLESLMRSGTGARADAPVSPRRYLTWFWGNGIVPAAWVPATTGTSWTAPSLLAPLVTPALRPYVSVVTNTQIRSLWQPHSGGASGILTGSGLVNAGDSSRATPASASIDQLIADAIEPAPGGLRSLELGVVNHFAGADGSVYNYISHRGPGMPNAYDRDPRSVFARLFGTVDTVDPLVSFRGSVLDAVLADAASLSSELSATDRARLDQHLTSVRELELRVRSSGAVCTPPMNPSSRITDAMITSEHGPGQNLTLINDTMSELLAMALACDLTRVASYMYTGPAAFTRYWEVDGAPLTIIDGMPNPWGMPEGVHSLAHGGGGFSPEALDPVGLELCLRESMRHFARTLEILRTTPDGDGNLLDNLAILGSSCTSYGPTHSHDEYPIVVAGLAGGALRGGLHHRFASPENAARVPLTLAHAVGAMLPSFGLDAARTTEPVRELLA